MYMNESNQSIVTTLHQADRDAQISESGLYIKDRSNTLIQMNIPEDMLAFQIGEAAQIASRGLLVATPHLVKALALPFISRNTFAVFLQPNVDYPLTLELTFDEFTKQVMKRHY